MSFAASSHIPAPPRAVWDVLTDWAGGVDWRPGMEQVEVQGTGSDTRLAWQSRGGLRAAAVTTWSPPHLLEVCYTQGPVVARYAWALEPADDGTRVTLTVQTEASGAARLMLPVFTTMIRNSDEVLPERLRDEVRRRGL